MLSADENKPVNQSGHRNPKKEQQSGNAQRSRKSTKKPNSRLDQLRAAEEQVSTTSSESYLTSTIDANTDQAGSVASETIGDRQEQVSAPATLGESYSTESTLVRVKQVGFTASVETVPVSFQSLAKAYEDYAKKSFEETRFLFEKLAGVRSLDKALELQADFMNHAWEASIAESQKIRDIHKGLARQGLAYLERVVANMAPIAYILRDSRN